MKNLFSNVGFLYVCKTKIDVFEQDKRIASKKIGDIDTNSVFVVLENTSNDDFCSGTYYVVEDTSIILYNEGVGRIVSSDITKATNITENVKAKKVSKRKIS